MAIKLADILNNRVEALSSEDILKIYKEDETRLSNLDMVIKGINRNWFSISKFNGESKSFNYKLYHVINDGVLKGHCINLNSDFQDRNTLVLYFSFFIADNNPQLSALEVYNTYQMMQIQMFEKSGYATYGADVVEEILEKQQLTGKKMKLRFEGDYIASLFVPVFSEAELVTLREMKELSAEFDLSLFTTEQISFIYLMYDPQKKQYKIGKSDNPDKRLKQGKTFSPGIKLIKSWKCSPKVELFLKRKFKYQKLEGEWYNFNDTDIKKLFLIMKFLTIREFAE